MNYRAVITAWAFVIFPCALFSQSPELGKQTKNIIAPTPNVASIAKYGDIPVGYFTGSAEIKIPIFQVEGRGMQLPVSLTYSGGGIKVADAGSWVGAGWSLIAGGVITRAVAGRPDEQKQLGYFESIPFPTSGSYLDYTEAANRYDHEPDMFFYNFPGGSGKFIFNKQQQISCIPERKLDITFQYAGYSPLNPSGLFHAIRAIVGFTIVGEDGMKYVFEDTEEIPEQTRRIPSGSGPDQVTSNTNEVAAPQSWFLSKMISPLKDTIYFDYSIRPILVKMPPSVTFHIAQFLPIPDELNEQNIYTFVDQTTYSRQLSRIRFKGGSIEFKSYNPRYDLTGDSTLDEIIIRNPQQQAVKRYKFAYRYLKGMDMFSPSTALASFRPEELKLFLQSIQETDGTGTITNNPYVFDYLHSHAFPHRDALAGDYWGYHNGIMDALPGLPQGPLNSVTGADFKRQFAITKQANAMFMGQGMLTKVTYPTGGSTEFEYEPNRVTADRIPPQYTTRSSSGTYIADKNAFQNAAEVGRFTVDDLSGSAPVPIMYEYDAVYQSMASLSSYYFQLINVADNSVLQTYTAGQCGAVGAPVLNANNRYECRLNITIPNGTYKVVARNEELPPGALSDFTFFIFVGPWSELTEIAPSSEGVVFGGMRVKKIKDKDFNNTTIGTRRFEYDQEAAVGDFGTFGYSKKLTVYWPHEIPGVGILCSPYSGNFEIFSYNSYYPLQQSQGSYVGYGKVRVFREDSTGVNSGYTEYDFASPRSYPPDMEFVEVPFAPQPNNTEWMYGLQLGERQYRKLGAGDYELAMEVKSFYKPVSALTAALGIKRMLIDEIKMTCPAGYPNNQPADKYYKSKNYTVYTGHPVLDSVVTTVYEGGNQLRKFERYHYNNQFLLSRTITGNSQGELEDTRITYPFDFNDLTAADAFTQGIKNLQTGHILSWPVEKSIFRTNMGGTGSRLVSSVLAGYKPTQPVQDVVYQVEGAPLTNFTPAQVSGGAITKDVRFKPVVNFNLYDAEGNLLQQQKANDVTESYIWGYNKLYPVAKITGADHATAATLVSQAVLDNPLSTDAQMRTELNKLRINLPGAQVTTFTYAPLVGVTSITGPEGRTVYYEYDPFLRLRTIKDHDGKILKHVDYKYQVAIP